MHRGFPKLGVRLLGRPCNEDYCAGIIGYVWLACCFKHAFGLPIVKNVIVRGTGRGYIGDILGRYWDNGKEDGHYHLWFRVTLMLKDIFTRSRHGMAYVSIRRMLDEGPNPMPELCA